MKQIARTKGTLLRVFACVWAVIALALACAAPAFAADTATHAANIEVSGVEGATEGTAYKVIDINWDDNGNQPVDPMYKWNDAVAQWVATSYPDYINSSDNAVTEKYANISDANKKTFSEALQRAVRSGDISNVISASGAISGNNLTFSDLPMGGYLISIVGTARVYKPIMQNVAPEQENGTGTWEFRGGTIKAVDKSSNVTFDKGIVEGDELVNSATGSIGSDVTFRLVAAVPSYPDNAVNTKFTMRDTLSAGLTYHDGLVVKAGDTKLIEDTDYSVTIAGQNVTIDFKYASIKGATEVTAEYRATINDNAVVGESGNPNTAYLDYANDPYTDSTYKTLEDKVKVFTFGVKIYKVDKANNNALTGAVFKVLDTNDAALKFVKIGDGKYRRPLDGETNAVEELEVDASGALDLKGFDAGTYKLEEVKAPAGYIRLNAPEGFALEATKDDNDDFTGHVEGDTQELVGYKSITVENGKGWSLPSTGDAGIFALIAAGIMLVGGGIMVVRGRRAE